MVIRRLLRYPPRGWLLVVLIGCAFTASAAAQVTARLDRDHVIEGETVTLVVQSNDPQQSLDADLAVLEPDFAVLDRRTETQMSIVNGRQSAVMRLLLTLEPRRTGQLTIPALAFGQHSTRPMSLQVEPAPQPEAGELPRVFIEVEVDPKEGPHYVHAQLRLTVRVLYLPELTEAAITPPEPSPASVRLLDEVPFQAERGGQRYRVLERHYAIFPERSGRLAIPAMKLSGRLVERRADNLWQPAVRGRRIEVESEAIELDIAPRPAAYSGDAWLPARSLDVSQTLSASDALSVGEPVTRTVIVDAVGLEENMIAEPGWPQVPGTRIYPDQPQGITRDDGRWVLGHKEFRYAVVPEQEGEIVLPRLEITWWDTVNDREATAVLPEYHLQVKPSAAAPVTAAAAAPAAAIAASPRPASVSGAEPGFWRSVSLALAVLWLVTLTLLLNARRGEPAPAARKPEPDAAESAILTELRKACAKGDAAAARWHLLRWLRHHGPKSANGSLLEFARSCGNAELARMLRDLDAAGYRAEGMAAFDDPRFFRAFEAWRESDEAEAASRQAPVTDLYAAARESGRHRD